MTLEDDGAAQGGLSVVYAAGIVSAYVRNNVLQTTELPELIRTVHAALQDLSRNAPQEAEPPKPAVPIKRSIYKEYLVCLEDGQKFKSLKRHLRSKYGMTPEDYRQKWGLPADYPMVAPGYSEKRSKLAKKMGLGRAIREE